MLLAIVFILLLIWAAVVGSLYSNFIVFYKSFAEIDSYNKAYYASIAALERWELVVKQREPGYVWSGWWIWDDYINITNNNTDEIDSDFSYLVKSEDTNLLRDINSRTNRVPRRWEWDIDRMLATWDSLDYNKMDYEDTEVFLLYVDNLAGSPYSKTSCSEPISTACQDVHVNISWEIRLPPKIRDVFFNLNTNSWLVIWWSKDDEIVDWQLKWRYWTEQEQFTIFAKNKGVIVNDSSNDSVIKESDINDTVILSFWNDEKRRQPNKKNNKNSDLVVISSSDIESAYKDQNFSNILNPNGSSDFSRLNLKLSLLNLLKTESKMIYPYLEYYLQFTSDVADKYFKIDAEWRYKDYQVNIIMHKPTVKESVLWNFTVIF